MLAEQPHQHYFLYRVAQDLWARWVQQPDLHAEIVSWKLFFPSSRAKIHFINYLRQLATAHFGSARPLVLPAWGDIGGEIERIAGWTSVDPLLLLPELHRNYQRLTGEASSLEAFYHWGILLLRDFDQVDKYVNHPQELFRTLAAHKALERDIDILTPEQREVLARFFAEVSLDAPSPLISRYSQMLTLLAPLYDALQGYMQQQKEGYEGALLREALRRLADDPTRLRPATLPIRHFAFIGFNALNTCEKEFFTLAKQSGNTLFYWNYPPALLTPDYQDAALFVRENVRLFENALPTEDAPYERGERKLIPVPSVLAQAEAVAELLQQDPTAAHNAALILSDEQLLLPLLRSLPPHISYNITMGYPLRNTQVYTLLELLIAWLSRRDAASHSSPKKPLLALLQHPFLALLPAYEATREEVAAAEDPLEETNLSAANKLHDWIKLIDRHGLARFLSLFLVQIGEEMEREALLCAEHKLWQEYLVAAYGRLKGLEQMLLRAQIEGTPRLYQQLLPQAFRDAKVAFFGDPIGGLQIMGFLETRTLDFDEVTIVSCNEGHLPAVKPTVSFIPTSLGQVFGMPTLRERESMYSYYFQTIIARARRVRLIYTHSEDALIGEPSRYVLQERYATTPPLPVFPTSGGIPSLRKIEPPVVSKTGAIAAALNSFLCIGKPTSGLSLTALSEYTVCPLRFHFRYLQRIAPRDEAPSVELSPRSFGTLLHNTLQELYAPFVGKALTAQSFAAMRERLAPTLEERYKEERRLTRPLSGMERLECDIITELLNDLLAVDARRSITHIEALEVKVLAAVELADGRRLGLQGTIDRVDRTDEGYTLIDYKTGRYYTSYARYRGAERLFSPQPTDRSYVLQLLLYCFFWKRKMIDDGHAEALNTDLLLTPSLWFVNERLKVDLCLYRAQDEAAPRTKYTPLLSYSEVADAFEKRLFLTLEELFDFSRPFTATSELAHCDRCPYRTLCGR